MIAPFGTANASSYGLNFWDGEEEPVRDVRYFVHLLKRGAGSGR